MCSIFGAVGYNVHLEHLHNVKRKATDRGRDGGHMKEYPLRNGLTAYVGNWRATPTTEVERGNQQPYDGIVHNGTIANDDELGHIAGEIDSEVLPRILDRTWLVGFAESLRKVKGSYAIAAVTDESIFLACNYKPIYYIRIGDAVYFSSLERHLAGIVPNGTRAVKMPPYSVLSLPDLSAITLPRSLPTRAVVIASGGLDSTCVAAKLRRDGFDVHLLHFQYGCRAQTRESALIPEIANAIGATYSYQALPYVSIGGSSLLEDGSRIAPGIEGAEYAHEWVPARNLIMLSYATAYAEAHGYGFIALGNNLEEAGAYPDNEEEFTLLFDALLDNAVNEGRQVRVIAPVAHLMKHEIVTLGVNIGAPFASTWSCYKGGPLHCGECGPCYMRRTAFERNGLTDPVRFAT